VLKAFIDDSGSGDSKYFIMAGYVGTVSAWDGFNDQWCAALDEAPKIPYFHAAEANSLRPDSVWAGITEAERDAKIDRLIGVIQSFDLKAVYVRLRQSDYNEIFKGRVPEKWDSAYYCLFSSFIGLCGFVLGSEFGTDGPIEFVFDDHQKYRKHGQEFYDGFRLMIQEQTAPNVHFRNDKDLPPLQAADLLAWQARRAFCNPTETAGHFYESRKGGGRTHLHWSITQEQLWTWRRDFEKICDTVVRQKAEECGFELTADLRPWRAKNPDPEHASAHERWKELNRVGKLIQQESGIADHENRVLMKPVTEMIEGTEAFGRFKSAMKELITVPNSAVPDPFGK
jgi:hypothetical protein